MACEVRRILVAVDGGHDFHEFGEVGVALFGVGGGGVDEEMHDFGQGCVGEDGGGGVRGYGCVVDGGAGGEDCGEGG